MNGDGVGAAVTQGDGGDLGLALLTDDAFGAPVAVAPGTAPLVAAAEARDMAVVWQSGPGLLGRRADRDEPLEPAVSLGNGTGATELASDQYGDFAVAFKQDDRAVVARWDEPPSAARLYTSRNYKNLARAPLRWGPGRELWGPQAFRVIVDGAVVGTTTESTFTPRVRLADGVHSWAVESVDVRGQATRSDDRVLRVDAGRPVLRVHVTGPRRAGASLFVRVTASDARSGLDKVRTDFGDGSPRTSATRVGHRYRRGTWTLTVRAYDEAGNRTVRRVRLRIR
jgi:hypothetical protein